jgi:hypothetical protein
MEKIARDKHSNLLQKFVNCGQESIMTLAPDVKQKNVVIQGVVLLGKNDTTQG